LLAESNEFKRSALQQSTYGVGLDQEILESMLKNSQLGPRHDIVLEKDGHVITNEDVTSLQQNHRPTPEVLKYLLANIINQNLLQQSTPSTNKVYILSPVDLAELLRSNSLQGSDINVSTWLHQTASFKGQGNTIFDLFAKIIAVVKINPEHNILIEIRTGKFKLSNGFVQKREFPEIVIFDTNQKEHRFLHNSLYLIVKRFIYEELLDKAARPQSECYQASLEYSFRLGKCVQQPASNYLSRERDPDSLVYFLKNLDVSAKGGDLESTSFTARELGLWRLDLFKGIVFKN
jgi:hypothetical protein